MDIPIAVYMYMGTGIIYEGEDTDQAGILS